MKRHSLLVLLVVAMLILAAVPAVADPAGYDPNEAPTSRPEEVATPTIKAYDDTRRIIGDDIADTPVEMHEVHDQQHGPREGHLLPTQENVELVGQVDIAGTALGLSVGDVSVFGNYAYLAVRDPNGCLDAGVAIIAISDPTHPWQVGFIDATAGSVPGEGVQILDMQTKFFQGQLLVFNNQICQSGGEGGVSLWDVTDPLDPVVLTAHAGDADPPGGNSRFHTIHSAFAWQHGKQAFVVLVDNEEDLNVDILEITDPRTPVLLAETGLPEWPDAQDEQAEGIGTSPRSYFHDVQVKKVHGHMVMLLSYWDAGWVLVNVDDPAHPQFIDDFTYPDPDTLSGVSPPEGNAHQAEFSHNNQFIIGTDEDFRPFRLIVKITSGPSADAEFLATQGGKAPIGPDTPLQGPTYFVGLACDPTALPPAPSDFAIALIERGRCSLTHTAVNVAAAGYEAAIVFNTSDPVAVSPCERIFSPRVETDIPFVVVPRSAGFALLGIAYDPEDCPGGTEPALPAIGTRGADVHVSAQFEGWGYVRLLDAQTLEQIAAYAITEALDWRFASNFGALTVHEVATDPKQNLAYLSYYAGGLRVVAFGKDGIQEVGHYIAEGGNNFWGVEVHRFPTEVQGTDVLGREGEEQLILASDINSGLWIFRYTGK